MTRESGGVLRCSSVLMSVAGRDLPNTNGLESQHLDDRRQPESDAGQVHHDTEPAKP